MAQTPNISCHVCFCYFFNSLSLCSLLVVYFHIPCVFYSTLCQFSCSPSVRLSNHTCSHGVIIQCCHFPIILSFIYNLTHILALLGSLCFVLLSFLEVYCLLFFLFVNKSVLISSRALGLPASGSNLINPKISGVFKAKKLKKLQTISCSCDLLMTVQ